MSKVYSLSDVIHLLAVTNRQLDNLLVLAGIDKHLLPSASKDKRRRLLTQEQVDTLATLLAVTTPQETTPGSQANASLMRRIEALEREVKRLASELAHRRSQSVLQETSDLSAPQATQGFTGNIERRFSSGGRQNTVRALPDGMIGVPEFSERHGIPDSTAMRAIEQRHVTCVELDLWVESTHYKRALDSEGQRALLAWFANHSRYHQCDVADCPCHTL